MAKRNRKSKNRSEARAVADAPKGAPEAASTSTTTNAPSVGTLMFLCIIVLFFASGFSSLIYQVLWTRMLVLVFGATTFATSTVLAIFMGGLALGSFIAGRFCDRLKHPVLWYALLEGVIGIWAIFTPAMFDAATPLYKMVWQQTHASMWQLGLLRFFCTAAILIVPTTCMGATLPVLSRYLATSLESIGSRVGSLYASNTFGAVFGAALTGFLILPAVGLSKTLFIAFTINIALFVIGAIIWKRSPAQKEGGALIEGAAVGSQPSREPLPFNVMLATGVFACSGAIAMIYEVCWNRALLMVIGSNTYAFTVMLCSFLIGIFVGSAVCSRFIDRARDPMFLFALLQISIGILTLISMQQFNNLPYVNLAWNAEGLADPTLAMFGRFIIAGCALAPITVCLGAIFPAVVKTCTTDLAAVGRSIGFLYSANTVGAIVGAFLAGFVCLPLFGAEKTLILGALLNAALGLVLLCACGNTSRPVQLVSAVSGVVAIAALIMTQTLWDPIVLLHGQNYRRSVAMRKKFDSPQSFARALHQTSQLKYWADGTCSHVGVVKSRTTGVTSLMTNGHIDASDGYDMPVQSLLPAFPLLLHPDSKDVAVVGWGCGQTTGIATLFPVQRIDAIELEPKVIEASKFFHHMNLKPEQDPRVNLIFNDGRNFLLATDKQYDVIVSEPSNPWQAGVCNLFTQQYFRICKKRLKSDGILTVWLQIHEVPPADVCGVLAAIKKEFSEAIVFVPTGGNLVVCASNSSLAIDYKRLQSTLASNARLREQLNKVGITSPGAILGHIGITTKGMNGLVAAFVNSDDQNRLEFDVGRVYEDSNFKAQNMALIASLFENGNGWEVVNWGNMTPGERANELAVAGLVSHTVAEPQVSIAWTKESLRLRPTANAYRLMGLLEIERNHMKEGEEYFNKGVALDPDNVPLLVDRGSLFVASNKRDAARQDLMKAVSLDPKNMLARYALAGNNSLHLVGQPLDDGPEDADARAKVNDILKLIGTLPDQEQFRERKPNVCLLASQAYFRLKDFDKAERYLKLYESLASSPDEQRNARALLKMMNRYRTKS